jgi:hypothetical protein
VITTIIPPVNAGMAVALGVTVMHLWAVNTGEFYTLLSRKKVRQEVQPQLMEFESSTVKSI